MLKKEYEVLQEFIKVPWKRFTFREIKKLSGKKSESYVYNSLKKFVGQGFLSEEEAGNVLLYRINLKSLKTQAYAGFVAEHLAWNKRHIPYDDLEKISSRIPTHFFIFIITGSYARNTQNKDSDIDVVIICDDGMEPKKIQAELEHYCKMNVPRIHLYVFKKSEFLAMLLDKNANYGKEIAKNSLLLKGGEEYYNIISEAMQHGFNG